jgi:hypothetical protein
VRVVAVQPLQNLRQDSVPFGQRFTVSETKNLVTELVQLGGAPEVCCHHFRREVLASVEFDDQHRFDTSEVCEVPTDRTLATNLVATELPVAKRRPQASLSIGRGSAP